MWPVLPFEERPEPRHCLRRQHRRCAESVAGLNLAEVKSPPVLTPLKPALHFTFTLLGDNRGAMNRVALGLLLFLSAQIYFKAASLSESLHYKHLSVFSCKNLEQSSYEGQNEYSSWIFKYIDEKANSHETDWGCGGGWTIMSVSSLILNLLLIFFPPL